MSRKHDLTSGLKIPKAVKKTPVREEDARTFEEGTPSTPKKTSSPLRHSERGERIVVYIPLELAEKLRFRCVRERRSLSDAATEAFAEWLE